MLQIPSTAIVETRSRDLHLSSAASNEAARLRLRQLGYDTAILDWSVQDYILWSILVLFIPLILLITLMLVLTWLHQRLVLPMADAAGRLAAWVPRALRGAWLLWVPVAVALSVVAVPLSGITVAIAVTASLLCALYGDVLERRLTGRTRTSSAAKVLVLVLLTLAVFWDVERLANVAGEGYATQITANPGQLLASIAPRAWRSTCRESSRQGSATPSPPTATGTTACA